MWLGGVGLLEPAVRRRLGLRWTPIDAARLRVLGVASRGLGPVVPAAWKVTGPEHLHGHLASRNNPRTRKSWPGGSNESQVLIHAGGRVDGEVPGFAYATVHRERAAYRWATDVTVYVEPAYHRRGIGRSLYTALFDLLARQGFQVACAGITLPNQASVGLRESLGLVPLGVYRRIGFKCRRLAGAGPPAEPRPPARIDAAS